MTKSLGVFIGRFSPLHNGHLEVIKYGEANFDQLLIIVGSADQSPRLGNPFTIEERMGMVQAVSKKAIVESQNDYPYNDNQWVKKITENILSKDVTLLCSKPEWYHKLLPYKQIVVPMTNPDLSATWVRKVWGLGGITNYSVPPSTQAILDNNDWRAWGEEWFDCEEQKKRWPDIAIATDAMVTCKGRILLVTRGKYPGKGQLALPGGFLEEELWLEENARKELREETGVAFSNLNKPNKIQTFDWPKRSSRNRCITTCFHWEVHWLWIVKGGDDAAAAGWYDINTLEPTQMFEDHYHIIQEILK